MKRSLGASRFRGTINLHVVAARKKAARNGVTLNGVILKGAICNGANQIGADRIGAATNEAGRVATSLRAAMSRNNAASRSSVLVLYQMTSRSPGLPNLETKPPVIAADADQGKLNPKAGTGRRAIPVRAATVAKARAAGEEVAVVEGAAEIAMGRATTMTMVRRARSR
jgi:hypothetical protein